MKRKRLLTLLGSICLVLVLVALLLPACAKEEAPVTPTPAEKPIVWKFANYGIAKGGFNEVARHYFDEVEKRTGGRFKCEFYLGESLVPKKEQPEAIRSGICQATIFVPSYYPSKVPLFDGVTYPFVLPGSNTRQGIADTAALLDMYCEHPNLTKEFAKWDTMYVHPGTFTQYNMIGNKPVRTTADLKGKKIRVLGPNTEVLEYFGAVPVFTSIGDAYSALDTGLLDLFAHDFCLFRQYKLVEVSKYVTDGMFMGTSVAPIFLKASAFKALPEDIQKAMLEAKEESKKWFLEFYYGIVQKGKAECEKAEYGIEIIQFPPEERLKMVEAAKKTAWESFFAKTDELGVSGREMMEFITAEAEKMGYKY